MNLCKSCGMDGLGDTLDLSSLYPVDYSNPASSSIYDANAGNIYNPTSITATPSSGISTASMITGISNAFSQIFKTIQPLPAGCTVVAGPYGQSTQCSGTGTANTSSLSLSSLTSGSSSSLLLIGGAVLLVMMLSKR